MNKKIVLISGVSEGMGLAMLEEFIRDDCFVIGFARNADKIEELNSKHQGNVYLEGLDITDSKGLLEFSERVIKKYGTPDILINSASIINERNNTWDVSQKEFRKIMEVNFFGSLSMINTFGKDMIEKKRGSIINFSSYWGKYAEPTLSPYCASKFAIEGLTQSLSGELPDNMITIAFDPGAVHTGMLEKCSPDTHSLSIKPGEWSKIVVPYFSNLGKEYNGKRVEFGELL